VIGRQIRISYPRESGTRIIDNTFNNSYSGIYLRWQEAPHVMGNAIMGARQYGLYSEYGTGQNHISENRITLSSDSTAYGIYLKQCNASEDERGLVANNFVTVAGTGNATGIDMNYSGYQDILFNSVNVTNTSSSSRPLSAYGSDAYLDILNNIFANFGGGYAYYARYATDTNNTISQSDHNNLYTAGDKLAAWQHTDCEDLAALHATSGQDANSVSIDPEFAYSPNLHIDAEALDGKGTPLSDAVAEDIDGEPRNTTTPDIGADEFDPGAIIADFGADPIMGFAPLTVSFSNQSRGNITSWEWAFGDGNSSSTEPSPTHSYSNTGTYTVSLTVSGPGGDDMETRTQYVRVTTPWVSCSSPSYTVDEGSGSIDITVNLSAASGHTVTVDYLTLDATATDGSDYSSDTGTLTSSPGQTSQTLSIDILDDAEDEADETFNLVLRTPVNAVLGPPDMAALVIADDDEPIVTGDMDGSGSVDLADAILAMQIVLGMAPAQPIDGFVDANGDGRVGIAEVLHALQVVAGRR